MRAFRERIQHLWHGALVAFSGGVWAMPTCPCRSCRLGCCRLGAHRMVLGLDDRSVWVVFEDDLCVVHTAEIITARCPDCGGVQELGRVVPSDLCHAPVAPRRRT